MLLIEAIVMVAQEYRKYPGWTIEGPHGCLTKVRMYYTAQDADNDPVCIGTALEEVVASMVERDPMVARDEDWKISPHIEEA